MILGIVGQKNSGKSTIASIVHDLVREARAGRAAGDAVIEIAFADPMKEFCRQLFPGITEEQLTGPSTAREAATDYKRPDGVPLTARWALQTLGDWGRACYAEAWVDYAIRRVQRLARETYTRIEKCEKCGHSHDVQEPLRSVILLSDTRYPNEARAISVAGGAVWRVRRPGSVLAPDPHSSEALQFSAKMDRYVTMDFTNDGSLEELRSKVYGVLAAYGLVKP